jgi:hypothetical protein
MAEGPPNMTCFKKTFKKVSRIYKVSSLLKGDVHPLFKQKMITKLVNCGRWLAHPFFKQKKITQMVNSSRLDAHPFSKGKKRKIVNY